MNNINMGGINNIRVLEWFLSEPRKNLTYNDFKDLRAYTGESRITGALRDLAKLGILKEENAVGRPYRGCKRKFYSIIREPSTFERLFRIYSDKDMESFLKSNFTNIMIKEYGFETIYNTIESKLKDSVRFRELASKSLLELPNALHEFYDLEDDRILRSIRDGMINFYKAAPAIPKEGDKSFLDIIRETGHDLTPKTFRAIEILKEFDPLAAVRFYRMTVFGRVLSEYKKLEQCTIIPNSLLQFLKIDNYLSPLTAHPISSLEQLLFFNPFERLYDNSYIIDGDSRVLLLLRAYIIYSNFADFLFLNLKNFPRKPEKIKILVKKYIYHWNTASSRFDMCNLFLSGLEAEGRLPRNHHLRIREMAFEVLDLESRQPILSPLDEKGLYANSNPIFFRESKSGGKIIDYMDDPFTSLRPAVGFEILGFRSDFIRIDEILEDLWARLNGKEANSNLQKSEENDYIDSVLSELWYPYDEKRVHLYSLHSDDSGRDSKSEELFQDKERHKVV